MGDRLCRGREAWRHDTGIGKPTRGHGAVGAAVCGVSQYAPCAVAAAGGVVGSSGETGEAGWDRSYGAGIRCGSAEFAEVDGSIRAWSATKAAAAGTPASSGQNSERSARLRGTAGADYRCDFALWRDNLPGGSRIAARREVAAGVEVHFNQRIGRVDSRVRGILTHAADHAADADTGGGGSR